MHAPDAPELVTLIRTHYFPGADIAVNPIPKGEENQNYHVSADGNEYALRLYSQRHSTTGVREIQDIDFELDLIEALRSQHVPTPRAMRTLEGGRVVTTIISGQVRYAVLFEWIKGEEAAAYDAGNARSTAETILQIRGASWFYQYNRVRAWPGDMIEVSLDFYRKNRHLAEPYQKGLDAIAAKASEGYQAIQKAGLPRGIIHGDIKLGNLLFEGNRITAVLDFDDYRESYLLEELARTLLHDLDSLTRNAIRSGHFQVFQEVFEQDPSVGTAELAHLGTFMKARFVYDAAVYLISGYQSLVEALFEDPHVANVILR